MIKNLLAVTSGPCICWRTWTRRIPWSSTPGGLEGRTFFFSLPEPCSTLCSPEQGSPKMATCPCVHHSVLLSAHQNPGDAWGHTQSHEALFSCEEFKMPGKSCLCILTFNPDFVWMVTQRFRHGHFSLWMSKISVEFFQWMEVKKNQFLLEFWASEAAVFTEGGRGHWYGQGISSRQGVLLEPLCPAHCFHCIPDKWALSLPLSNPYVYIPSF